MAKKASTNGASKSEAIRNYKSGHQEAGPTAIAAALSKEGTKVTPAFVSTVLSNAKRKGRKGRRKMIRRKMVHRGPRAAVAARRGNDPVERNDGGSRTRRGRLRQPEARACCDTCAQRARNE